MTSLLPLLQLFPIAGNKTLADWAEPHVAAGETLGTLLSQRADAKDRAAAGRLRSAGIGLLNRLRDELARARKVDVSLAATLDQDLFAYADLLEVASATEAAEAKKAAEAQKAEEMTRKAEGKARRADDKTKRAAEAGRHARDAARRAEEAQKEAEAAAKAAAEAEQEAQAERDAKAKKGGGSDG